MKTLFTKAEIRKFLILYFGLNQRDVFGHGKEGILNYFDRVHNIQSDPLNIVGRNAEIILHNRFHRFSSKTLNEMLYEEYSLVDGFDKEAAIFRASDWGKFSYIRKALVQMDLRVLKYRHNEEALQYLEETKASVFSNPDSSSLNMDKKHGNEGRWGSNNLVNCALNHLYSQGEIGISNRKGNVKCYRDIKLMIPEKIRNDHFESIETFQEWYLLRRLDALGVYWLKSGAGWQGFYINDKKNRFAWMQKLLEKGKVIKISIEGIKEFFYLTPNAYQILLASDSEELAESVRFIAPLDNIIWDRTLVKELFDFEYVWEVYKPVSKRKFGYYVLPVLYKDIFIGRIEPSREKNRKAILEIENIWFEKEEYDSLEVREKIAKELQIYNETFIR